MPKKRTNKNFCTGPASWITNLNKFSSLYMKIEAKKLINQQWQNGRN